MGSDDPHLREPKRGSLRGKTDDLPMMSRPTDVLNAPFVTYHDL